MQINTFDHFVQQEDTEMKKEDGRVRITRQMIRTALLNLLRESRFSTSPSASCAKKHPSTAAPFTPITTTFMT